MAENGILDYQGMNQAIYRGATSNIVVDTQSMSIEIGAGNTSHTSNLHFECDHDANVASIKLNSNVVTEFSRSKKLIKYPRVAMTQNDESGTSGYVTNASSWENQASNETYGPWNNFNGILNDSAWQSYPRRFSQTTGDWDGTTTAPYAISLVGGSTIYGEWVELKIPNKIQLHTCRISPLTSTTYPNLGKHRSPRSGYILGRVGATGNWTVLKSWSDIIHGWEDLVLRDFDIENPSEYYDYFRVVWTAINGNNNYSTSAGAGYASSGEIEFLGLPEYDPEARGIDVTLKSLANVPNTDWLVVYYDAKGLPNEAVTNPISGLGGTTNNGTAYGNPQISDGAFDFDGTGDYIITAPIGFTGDQLHSVSLWFWSDKPQTDMTTEHGIYSFGYANNNRAGLSWWSPVTQPNSSLRFWHSGSGGKNFPGTTFLEDMWNHVVVVYPGDGADNIRIWLNGTELTGVQNTSVNNDFNWSASDTIVIGDWYTSTGVRGQSSWDGKIANFRLFNRVITSDEIYQLYAYQKEDFGHSTNNMTLKAGRLGIGTSEPRAALDVRGRIAREYNPGEIIEELNAICDGSTVTVQSGSYTMANITAYLTGTLSHQVITGSTINYTPPPGTKRVYYRFWFHWDAYRNSGISHFQFQIDDVVVTPSKSTTASNYASSAHHHGCWPMSVEYTIDCNASTDDASNGKFKSWTAPKELECTFRNYQETGGADGNGYRCLIHVNEWTDGTGNDSIKKPHLTVRAIA